MQQRIDWIDKAKGFAIFLMVMGHVIAWSFDSFDEVKANGDMELLVLWRFIYSFHMPLFMFCSGFLFYKTVDWFSFNNVKGMLWKRVQSLLIPYICAGFLIYLLDGTAFKYWFLWYLFIFSVFTAIVFLVFKYLIKIKWQQEIITALLLFISLGCFKIGGGKNPLFDSNLNFYLYFSLGIIYRMWCITDKVLKHNWTYTLSLLVFCALFCLKFVGLSNIWTSMITAIAGINVFVTYFDYHHSSKHKYWEWLGRMSLQIYIIHFFFTINIPEIGDYITTVFQQFDVRSVMVIEFATSFILSILVIFLCYLVNEILGKSDLLSRLFLGRRAIKE